MSDFEIREEDFEKKSFVVSEDSIPQEEVIEVSEDQPEEQPLETSSWSNGDSFVKWCVASTRSAPQIKASNVSSLKRAIAYYDNLEQELEKGVEADAEYSELNMDQLETLDATAEFIDTIRSQLRLASERTHMLKSASKSARFTYVVDPFIFAIARLCVNAKVANGKNIEDVYGRLREKFGLSERETLSVQQVLRDMGYPIHGSFVADDGAYDMITQYFA